MNWLLFAGMDWTDHHQAIVVACVGLILLALSAL